MNYYNIIYFLSDASINKGVSDFAKGTINAQSWEDQAQLQHHKHASNQKIRDGDPMQPRSISNVSYYKNIETNERFTLREFVQLL